MGDFNSFPFSRKRLQDLFTLITNNARARWPQATYLLNSDVAWQLPGSTPKDNLRLWYDERGIAAYAWFSPNSPVAVDVRLDLAFDTPLCKDLISWLEKRRSKFPPLYPWLISLSSMQEWKDALTKDLPSKPYDNRVLQVSALDMDDARRQFLNQLGFEPTGHFEFVMTRSLSDAIPEPTLPKGFRLRHVEEQDFDERVETHRDAWFKSGFTLDQYLRIRAFDNFEPTLDIVAEGPGGRFGSYCIGWIDRALGVGSFEPVGTRPVYRKLGLGQQVIFEGLRRMKTLGMHSAKIGTASFNDRAFRLYTSCGFKLIDKNRTWIIDLPS